MDLSDLRQEYSDRQFDIGDSHANPHEQFSVWYREAEKAELLEPNAMVLGSVDEGNRPCLRTVLLKSFDNQGFVFFTNYGSRKATQIEHNPRVSLLFQWLPLQRQVEISGTVQRIDSEETRKYFLSRPRGSQLGAWVSRQSEVVASRSVLDARLAELTEKFGEDEIPVPHFWGGYRVFPDRFEFWQGRPSRLHDRICYESSDEPGNPWSRQRLSP